MKVPSFWALTEAVRSIAVAFMERPFAVPGPPPDLPCCSDPLGGEWVLWPGDEYFLALYYYVDPNFGNCQLTLDYPGTSGIRLEPIPWKEVSEWDYQMIPLLHTDPPVYAQYGTEVVSA